MSWTENTEGLLCDIALQGCRETVSIISVRLSKDTGYSHALRAASEVLFDQLWPVGGQITLTHHLELVCRDIERMPIDLLEDVSDCLTRRTRLETDLDPAERGAAKLLAGWLKCRAIEMRDSGITGNEAQRLKHRHEQLYLTLFGTRQHEDFRVREA